MFDLELKHVTAGLIARQEESASKQWLGGLVIVVREVDCQSKGIDVTLSGLKIDLVFHCSEVDQTSTRNSWIFDGQT